MTSGGGRLWGFAWVGLVVAASLLTAKPAHAYAWMIRHGFAECGSCHVDPMGGETLTGMGRVMGETRLATRWSEGSSPTNAAKLLYGIDEPDGVRLGGSLRLLSVTQLDARHTDAFPMQADVYGAALLGRFTVAASVGVSRASERYEHASKARLIGPADEDDALIAVSRTHWLGYRVSDALMLRAGRMNLPFGVRMPEHTLWVREETATDRESDQLHGVSLVYDAGALRGELMGAIGNFQLPDAAFQQRGYSGYLEYLLEPRLALGVSSLFLTASRGVVADSGSVSRTAHGLTLRYAPWRPLVVLAEGNVLKITGYDLGYVGMATFDLEPFQGLHLALTGELLKRGLTRAGAWLTANWFVAPHVDLRLDFVVRQERSAMVLGQLHFYL